MRSFVIVGKGKGCVLLHDKEFGGNAVATYYTVNQLIDAGAEVLGVKSRKPFSYAVLNADGTPAAHVPNAEGTKRSAVTFLKGIKKSRAELKAIREATEKRQAVLKAKKAEEKRVLAEKAKAEKERLKLERAKAKERAEAENKAKKEAKVIASAMKRNAVSYQRSKCQCLLSFVRNTASEYHEEEKEHYILFAGSASAMSAMVKVLRNDSGMTGREVEDLVKRLRDEFKSNGRASCRVPLEWGFTDNRNLQVGVADEVTLSVENTYEDESAEWTFRRSNGYRPEMKWERHWPTGCGSDRYGSTADGDGSVTGFGRSLLLHHKHIRNMPYMGSLAMDSSRWFC